MRNPPDEIKFDATSFCSEFLRPLITDLSIVKVTSATTTSTSVVISLVYASPVTTKTSIPAKTTSLSTPTTTSSPPLITTSPVPLPAPANALKKRSFTVPEYLEPWYFYGRLDPGCSCIITSADPSILISATETSTVYEFTVSTTVTEVYTIYPGMQ